MKLNRIAKGLLFRHADHTGGRHRTDDRSGNVKLVKDQTVRLSGHLHKFPQKALPGDLMLLPVYSQLCLGLIPVKDELDLPVLYRFAGLPGSQYRLKRRCHRGTVLRFHPCCQRDRERAVLVLGVPAVVHGQLRDLLDHLRREAAFLREGNDIALSHDVALAERYQNKAPGQQNILHSLRNLVYKRSVQFVISDINDYLCVSVQASSNISLISTRSSIGYLWPLISW